MKAGLALVALLSVSASACAQNPDVFRVFADDVKLTGFRLAGQRGIVTALHGVAGRHNIRAKSAATKETQLGLRIYAVDIPRDLVLLVNHELLAEDASRGIPLSKHDPHSHMRLRLVGYPDRIHFREISTAVVLRDPPVRRLSDNLDRELLGQMVARGSPDPSLLFASIQGEMRKGHSGAPLLDHERRVLAVGNGGFDNEISWAVILKEVDWRSIDDAGNEVAALVDKPAVSLHSTARILDSPVQLSLVEDRDDSTVAKASGKVSFLATGKIIVHVDLYVRKSGVNGTGYAVAVVDLHDISGNTIWRSEPLRKHKGASFPKGVATGERAFEITVPQDLIGQVTGASLAVKAEDTDGFDPRRLRDLMKAVRVEL